ncbi:vanillate monooxygenase, beta subunit [Janthinobacterium sp. Marseille]|nr:PDR/VanB family oxidoreductase [Janthinobacterium sp. Marseille]ABR89990.1 vanillate monooxygenase, beta subunit [Janthinobacterium sp. Marseille]
MDSSPAKQLTPITVVVSEIRALTPTIKAFVLHSTDGTALPAYTAGAHIRVQVILPGGDADERSYSLIDDSVGSECRSYYRIAVQREAKGKGGSAFMHGLEVGSHLSIRPPKNDFPLDASARHNVLIAGGIGITPILAMAYALQAGGRSFEFHYGTRSPDLMAFRDVVETFRNAALYFDGGDPRRGLQLEALLAHPANGKHVYVCGPRGLIDAVIATAKHYGWADDHVHFELFNSPAAQGGDTAFEVELRASGKTLQVPVDKSILDVILAAGCDLMYDCKRGECGMCATAVLEGIPDHRDYNLPEDERAAGKVMCICVSRAKSARLVLDI